MFVGIYASVLNIPEKGIIISTSGKQSKAKMRLALTRRIEISAVKPEEIGKNHTYRQTRLPFCDALILLFDEREKTLKRLNFAKVNYLNVIMLSDEI